MRLRQVDNEQRDWRPVEVKQSKEDRDDEQRVEPQQLMSVLKDNQIIKDYFNEQSTKITATAHCHQDMLFA